MVSCCWKMAGAGVGGTRWGEEQGWYEPFGLAWVLSQHGAGEGEAGGFLWSGSARVCGAELGK